MLRAGRMTSWSARDNGSKMGHQKEGFVSLMEYSEGSFWQALTSNEIVNVCKPIGCPRVMLARNSRHMG